MGKLPVGKERSIFPSTFRRLEVFIAVVDAGTFVAAAEALGISHPSVSNHIQALERQIGCQLFQRRRGSVAVLTEQGRRLYERGVALLDQSTQLARDLAVNRGQTRRKPLTISSLRTVAAGWLCRPFARYAKEHPEIQFFVDIGRYESVVADMIEGRADLGFLLSFGPVLDLPCERIGAEQFSFFASPNNPLATKDVISPQELIKQPFIMTRRENRFGQMVQNMLAAAGVADYNVAYQMEELTIVYELAVLGMGVFCAPDRIVSGHVHSGALVRLPVQVPALSMDVHCALSPRRRPEKAAVEFAGYLRTYHANRACA